MSKNTISFLLILFCLPTIGQNLRRGLDLKFSSNLDIRNRTSHLKATALEGNDFVVIEVRNGNLNREFDLVKYDSELKEKKRNTFTLKDKDDFQFQSMIYEKGELILFNTARESETGNLKLYANPIDTGSLRWKGEPILLRTVDHEKSRRNRINYNFIKSPDRSKLLVVERNEINRKEFLNYGLQVFDFNNGFHLLWKQEYTSENLDRLEDIETMCVANDGTAYLLFIQYKDYRKTKRSGDPNYKYVVKEYHQDQTNQHSIPIELKDEFITDMQIAINQSENLVCTGFYSSEGTFSTKGAYYLLFDRTSRKVIQESTEEFSLDFLTANLNERQMKKTARKKEKGKDVELDNFDLHEIVLREDGGVIQVAERFYISQYTFTDINGFTSTTYTYHYEDIIIMSIAPNGRFDWSRKIRKSQASNGGPSPFASYHLSVIDDNLLFFHNGNAQNLLMKEKDSPRSWNMGKKATGIVTEINVEGFLRKDAFCDVPGQRFIPNIRTAIQLQSNEILFFGSYKKDSKYLRVKYNP